MEEEILIKAVKKQLRTEPMMSPWDYRVTMSQLIPHKGGYVQIFLNIDNHPIKVMTSKDIRRGIMQYFYYDEGKECFENGQKKSYHIYVPSDLVLDGKVFFTSTKEERRRLKLEKIKNKLIYK